MQPVPTITPDTLRLADDVHLNCDWGADLFTLLTRDGTLPLNRTAASILSLCDGRATERDLVVRFARGDVELARHVAAFIEAARRRHWIMSCHIGVTRAR